MHHHARTLQGKGRSREEEGPIGRTMKSEYDYEDKKAAPKGFKARKDKPGERGDRGDTLSERGSAIMETRSRYSHRGGPRSVKDNFSQCSISERGSVVGEAERLPRPEEIEEAAPEEEEEKHSVSEDEVKRLIEIAELRGEKERLLSFLSKYMGEDMRRNDEEARREDHVDAEIARLQQELEKRRVLVDVGTEGKKKLFFPNLHEVSNEFRALPTLHKEGRAANPEEPADSKARSEISSHYEDGQPRTAGALNRRQWKAGLADKLQTKYKDDRELQVAKIERRLEKERTKSLIGRKLQEEN